MTPEDLADAVHRGRPLERLDFSGADLGGKKLRGAVFEGVSFAGTNLSACALDESLLFYLKARGLPEKQAQALLIQAFVGEAIEQIADDVLREHVIGVAERWLERRQ